MIKHAHVEQVPGVCGGRPVISGTRFPVNSVVTYILHMGKTPEELARDFPALNLAQIHDALSYYYDNRDEIDRYISENTEEKIKAEFESPSA
jgi:uncharacterized protein (DUF433 family)